MKLAEQICKFPQECMNRDRKSAFYAMYEATSFKDAVDYEMSHGLEVIQQESITGNEVYNFNAVKF